MVIIMLSKDDYSKILEELMSHAVEITKMYSNAPEEIVKNLVEQILDFGKSVEERTKSAVDLLAKSSLSKEETEDFAKLLVKFTDDLFEPIKEFGHCSQSVVVFYKEIYEQFADPSSRKMTPEEIQSQVALHYKVGPFVCV